MTMRRFSWLLLAFALVWAAVCWGHDLLRTIPLTPEEVDIYEAIFRSRLDRLADSSPRGLYLLVQGHNPPAELLDRFGEDAHAGVWYRAGAGFRLSAGRITQVGDDTVRVGLAVYMSSRTGRHLLVPAVAEEGYQVTLVRKSGRWVIFEIENIAAVCG